MYLSMLNGDTTLESILSSTALSDISEELTKKRSELRAHSKTSQLWLEYQHMLSIARSMIKADRTGSWENHLHAVCNASQYLLQRAITITSSLPIFISRK